MDRNKKIIITLSILTVIFTILGGTLAYWRWQTSEEQKTNVVFTLESDFSCAADGGGNISQGDVILVPTEVNEQNSNNYIKRTVTVTPTVNVADKTIYMDLWLDINSIGTGLSNSDYFMYSFTTTDTSPYDDVVVTGNFKGKQAGDKIELFTENEYSSSNPVTFYLWIWLDAAEESSSTMNQSFSLSLNGSCTDVSSEVEPSSPVLDEGMIPITFDVSGDNTIIKTVSTSDSSWYDYSNKEWANAILVTESSRDTYLNTSGVEVNQSDILAYLVWIPRYKYKIWTLQESSTGSEQEIEIIFESKDEISTGSQVGEYITHPAFWWDNDSDGIRDAGEELSGIWVGKFETTGDATTPTILPDVTSLRDQNISTQFQTALKFAGGTLSGSNVTFTGSSTYGLTTNTDSHMMKNSEWGAVAYLSHSKYGVNREVYINNSSDFYTGRSGGNVGGNVSSSTNGTYTWDGFLTSDNITRDLTKVASTTGNITGVYDMSGGASEYVMGNYNNRLGSSGFSFSTFPVSKYYDLYTSTTSSLTACNGGVCYGHALSETESWYRDIAFFVSSSFPWFNRGGMGSGVFGFDYHGGGNAYSSYAARLVFGIGA